MCFLFYWIRFYVPVLMAGAVGLWMMWQWPDPRKFILLPLIVVAVNLPLPTLGQYTDMLSAKTIVTDLARFSLTPLPWNVEAHYSFLVLPAILHLMMFVPAILGAWLLWRDVPGARLYLIYLAAAIALYSSADELLGPRQRVQVSFVFIWAQYHFIRNALQLPHWQAVVPAAAVARNPAVDRLDNGSRVSVTAAMRRPPRIPAQLSNSS